MSARDQVLEALEEMGIPFRLLEHEAVSHIDDCLEIARPWGAVYCKNYFLTTKSRKVYAVCVVRPEARLRTSDVSRQAGTPRLSFAGEEAMEELLHTRPGAVTPLGLLFDTEGRVLMLADAALREAPLLAFHPCDNRATVLLRPGDLFETFLPGVRHAPRFIGIHDLPDT